VFLVGRFRKRNWGGGGRFIERERWLLKIGEKQMTPLATLQTRTIFIITNVPIFYCCQSNVSGWGQRRWDG